MGNLQGVGGYLAAATALLAAVVAQAKPKVVRTVENDRVVMVKFQVHLHKCTSCGDMIASTLAKVEGVLESRAVTEEDAAIAFFRAGRADLEEMKAAIRKAGFAARLVAGPVATTIDGQPEAIDPTDMPRRRGVIKEEWDRREREKRANQLLGQNLMAPYLQLLSIPKDKEAQELAADLLDKNAATSPEQLAKEAAALQKLSVPEPVETPAAKKRPPGEYYDVPDPDDPNNPPLLPPPDGTLVGPDDWLMPPSKPAPL